MATVTRERYFCLHFDFLGTFIWFYFMKKASEKSLFYLKLKGYNVCDTSYDVWRS